MDIEELVKEKAPMDNAHDKAYRLELRYAHEVYKDMDLHQLRRASEYARMNYDSSHMSAAECMVLQKLIDEKLSSDKTHPPSNLTKDDMRRIRDLIEEEITYHSNNCACDCGKCGELSDIIDKRLSEWKLSHLVEYHGDSKLSCIQCKHKKLITDKQETAHNGWYCCQTDVPTKIKHDFPDWCPLE